MNCAAVVQLLEAYLDGELDQAHRLEIDQHLQQCTSCSQHYQQLQVLSTATRDQAAYYSAPAALRQHFLATASAQGKPTLPTPRTGWFYRSGLAASLLLAVGLGSGITYWAVAPEATTRLEQEAIASHVRSLMLPTRLTDVTSSDRHTVKPWFNGKLDFAPPVFDLTTDGFPLLGGRLDYFNNRPAAALVYRRRQHVINVFIIPVSVMTAPLRFTEQRGFTSCHWTQDGLQRWAVADISPEDLKIFCERLRAAK
ncbi:MAG: anti-sigma factor [Gammaproteobacteria bacterium]|nr:anti-sigma factor [Gammaproteobacteria bacterium]